MKRTIILTLAVLIFLPAFCFAFPAQCVKVADGDTITVLTPSREQVRVRLYGIDCPETVMWFNNNRHLVKSDGNNTTFIIRGANDCKKTKIIFQTV